MAKVPEKREHQDVLSSPTGGTLKVNWMPGKRVRLDFAGFGAVAVTKIFSSPNSGKTNVEISYGN